MLTVDQVPLSQSALLVVDVQDSFRIAPKWSRRSNRDLERNVSSLISAYRAAKLPVIFFLHTDGDEGFAPDSPYFKLMDGIEPEAGEPVIVKDTRNCFTSTNLEARLLETATRRLAITGIQMEQCCETTARVAADLGYAVDFVLDGTMTFPIQHPDDPDIELGVEEITERTVFALRGRFARITSTAELLEELRGVEQ